MMYLAGVDCLLSFLESVSNWLWHHTVQEFIALAPFFFKFFHVLLKGSSFVGFLNNRQFIVVDLCSVEHEILFARWRLDVIPRHWLLPEGTECYLRDTKCYPKEQDTKCYPRAQDTKCYPMAQDTKCYPSAQDTKCYPSAQDTKCYLRGQNVISGQRTPNVKWGQQMLPEGTKYYLKAPNVNR